MYFDTHVNLHAEQFQADLPEVIARARAAGVTRMVTICDRLDRYPAVKAIAETNNDINCTVGVHPHYAKDYWSLQAETLVAEAAHPKVCGIGETGLDQHYGYSDIVLQERSFVEHIEAARETGLLIAGGGHAMACGLTIAPGGAERRLHLRSGRLILNQPVLCRHKGPQRRAAARYADLD